MVQDFVAITMPPAGGGGMAQASLFDRLFPYLVWGLVVLIACAVGASILRRIYRTPNGDPDE